jgi:hypothetical protein
MDRQAKWRMPSVLSAFQLAEPILRQGNIAESFSERQALVFQASSFLLPSHLSNWKFD